jgi:hypothetical protein
MSYPIRNELIKFNMLFYCCFAHPTIMFRSETIGKDIVYKGNIKMEDYDLWLKLISLKKYKFANLGCVLLRHRKHEQNESML